MLASVGQLAARMETETPEVPTRVEHTDWVRTTRGWEKLDTSRSEPTTRKMLHPAIVAGGQLLASLLALVAWSGGKP
jgi:hypothetical protein